MALVIRLRQQGRRNRQSYRIVLADRRFPRDGKYLEKLGHYDPHGKEDNNMAVESERVQFWVDRGAIVSERVQSLLRKAAPVVIQAMMAKKVKKKSKPKVEKAAKPVKKSAKK